MKDSGPAFPVVCQDISKFQVYEPGMTLRDWFAGMALLGIMRRDGINNRFHPKDDAEWCYQIADAMLQTKAGSQPA